MHGDKRWIRDYTGRLKRSNDRSWKDWRGDLKRLWSERKDEEKYCPECEEVRQEVGTWVYGQRYDHEVRCWVEDRTVEKFVSPLNARCEYHRWKDNVGYKNPYHKKGSYYSYTPKMFRKAYNQQERARVRDILNHAKYDDEKYDELSTKQMVKLGYYW